MAFRGKLIEMIESHVEALKSTKYVITDVMQSNFVGFVNSFLKHHSNYNAVEFKLSSNLLFAQMDNIRIIIAADETKGFCIPGSDNELKNGVNMREPVEAFILIGDNMCYDSVLMRTFFPNTAAGEDKYEPYVPAPAAQPAPAPAAQTNSTNFIFQGAATASPAAQPAPTPAQHAPTPAQHAPTPAQHAAPTGLFAQTPTAPASPAAPTNLFAQTPAAPVAPAAPTNLFSSAPATTSSFSAFSTPATTSGFSAFSTPATTTTFSGFSKPATTSSFSAFSKPATPSLTFGGSFSRQNSLG
ncbi:hypothetical protein ATCVMN08101_507L [Acanthocystis turfacea Chlorella virus MN0810.1]|nr:hypothetical protein ATCVMN08101_507L [Acanthocystis turfacea Chlorella virus MN0810.1]